MIAGAEDEVACELAVGNGRTLRLHVDAEPLLPDAYRATVWASHAGDEVLRQEVTISSAPDEDSARVRCRSHRLRHVPNC